VVGAGVGGAIAFDAARRSPNDLAAVVWLTPVTDHPGLPTADHAKTFPADKPLLLLAHDVEKAPAETLHGLLPNSVSLVYEDEVPAGVPAPFAHGTSMLGKLPLVEQTIASFLAMRTGSQRDDVLLDGVVEEGGGPWTKATPILADDKVSAWAYRVGRRIEFGGLVHSHSSECVMVGVESHFRNGVIPVEPQPGAKPGFPEIAAIDLQKGVFAWSEPHDANKEGGQMIATIVRPVVRVVPNSDGFSFEGEFVCELVEGPKSPEPTKMRMAFDLRDKVPDRPKRTAQGILMEVGWRENAVLVVPR
jgi:hypothetical protein